MISALFKLALSPAGKAVSAFLAVATIARVIYVKGRADGRASVLNKIAADRITILKDGKEIDDAVLGADDNALCALLGGCL